MSEIQNFLHTSETDLIREWKRSSEISDALKETLFDNAIASYEWLVHNEMLFDRIRIWAMNISQYASESDEIIPVYAFFQKYAKHIMYQVRDIEISNIDIVQPMWKDAFLNECNQKILSSSVLWYIKYAMYDFYEQNPSMIQFKMPFLEIANAAWIVYILSKYWIDQWLLNKTEEERIQRRKERMAKWWIVMPVDPSSDPEVIAETIKKHLDDKNEYLNSN